MNCYVTNPSQGSSLPRELTLENTLFYPEQGMTTAELLYSGAPASFHIVTDSPFLVPLYPRLEVFLWVDGEWANPNFETYGLSYTKVIMQVFGYPYTIPAAAADGNTTNIMGHGKK